VRDGTYANPGEPRETAKRAEDLTRKIVQRAKKTLDDAEGAQSDRCKGILRLRVKRTHPKRF